MVVRLASTRRTTTVEAALPSRRGRRGPHNSPGSARLALGHARCHAARMVVGGVWETTAQVVDQGKEGVGGKRREGGRQRGGRRVDREGESVAPPVQDSHAPAHQFGLCLNFSLLWFISEAAGAVAERVLTTGGTLPACYNAGISLL